MGGYTVQFRLHAEIIGSVLLVSIVMTFALSPRLRKPIAEPILALADVARGVAENKDYSVRAAKRGEDEVGLLTDAFNQMLGGDRDGAKLLFRKSINPSREQTREIVESINVLVSSSSEIFATSTQLASGAAETATAVSQTTITVEKVRQTAHLASVKARSVSGKCPKDVTNLAERHRNRQKKSSRASTIFTNKWDQSVT